MPGVVPRYGGLYGQNPPYKFKNLYGEFLNRNFEKSHRTTGLRSDPMMLNGFVIPGKFWSRNDLGHHPNRKKLDGHQGRLRKRTVSMLGTFKST